MPVPSVVNGRLEKDGEIDRYRLKVEPGEKLLFELQARELGTSRLEGDHHGLRCRGKKLDSAGDKPLPEDVFAVQGTSRTSSDPFLNLTVPPDVHEIVVTVEDLALRGGPLYGYRLIARRQAEDFTLSHRLAVRECSRRRHRGHQRVGRPARLRRPHPADDRRICPRAFASEGGMIPREYVDAEQCAHLQPARHSDADRRSRRRTATAAQLQVWGEGKLADGTVLRRRARGPGMVVDVAGATEQGVVDRQRPRDRAVARLGPAGGAGEAARGHARSAADQDQADGGGRALRVRVPVERCAAAARRPKQVGVDVIGAKDIRVIDMKPDGKHVGTFAVTTTKATDPARYDLYINGRVQDGRWRRSRSCRARLRLK